MEFGDQFNSWANKLKEGDMRAGEEIFESFGKKIFRYFMARTLHKETAEDLTQDVFLKIVKNIKSFDDKKGNFSGWLWQIARNTANDYYSAKSRREVSVEEFIGKYEAGKQENLNDKAEAQRIMETVKGFSQLEQEIFSLRHLSGMSYKEISGITDKPEGSLRVMVLRLNDKIKKIYAVQKD